MTGNLRSRALVLIAGYAGVSMLAYYARHWYLATLLPAIGLVVDWTLPSAMERSTLALTMPRDQMLVALGTVFGEPTRIGRVLVPAGEHVDASTLAAYALHHLALVYAVLIAWPARAATGRAALLLLGLPAVLLSTLLDIPFVLSGLVHDLLIEAGATELASKNLALYYEFVHRGGRVGLAIAAAVAAGLAVERWEASRRARATPAP